MEIIIGGKRYAISCPPGEENNLLEVATKLNHLFDDLSKRTMIKNREQLMLMAALHFGYQLNQNSEKQSERENRDQIAEQKLEELQAKINAILANETA